MPNHTVLQLSIPPSIHESILLFVFDNFIYLFFGSLMHGLFFSCSKWGYSLVAVHGHLLVVASFVMEHGLQGMSFSC